MRIERSPWVNRLAAAAAAALLIGALGFAATQVDPAALAKGSWTHLLPLAALVMVNIAVTGLLFWAVTRCFDADPRVGPLRMTQLVAVSALLNYVPLIRPGLLGRTAYLKLQHGLPVRQSLVILIVVTVLAVAVCGGGLLALLPAPAGVRWGLALVAVLAGSAATPALARWLLRRPVVHGWLWVPLRTLDLLAASARLWLAFQAVGQPVGYDEAVVIGAASLTIKLVGLTPSGLGLSEWAVAGLAGVLAPISTAQGMLAALMDRGVEVIVVAIAGALAAWSLRHVRDGAGSVGGCG